MTSLIVNLPCSSAICDVSTILNITSPSSSLRFFQSRLLKASCISFASSSIFSAISSIVRERSHGQPVGERRRFASLMSVRNDAMREIYTKGRRAGRFC